MRRGQLQTLEPVVIVIFLGVILALGLIFFMRISDSDSARQQSLADERYAVAIMRTVTTMPELACSRAETVQTFCIDTEKAYAFAEFTSSLNNGLEYFPLFGSSTLELEWQESTGLVKVVLYNASAGGNALASSTYFTVHDPITDTRRFATLTVLRDVS